MFKTLLTLVLVTTATQASVTGQIQRFEVTDTTKDVYRPIGQVSNFCTGTMISPFHVLTAGHCVYDVSKKTFAQNVTFSPARKGRLNPFGTVRVTSYVVHPRYVAFGDANSDLAVLRLESPIGLRTGWFGIDFSMSGFSSIPGTAVGGHIAPGTITGYPGDKHDGTMWLVACSFRMTTAAPMKTFYTCDTYGGMSGSALAYGGPGGKSVIFGVHTSGHGKFNSGVLLTGGNADFVRRAAGLR